MTFAPYPVYKPSGIDWLGDVPSHWDLKRTDGFLRESRNLVEPNALIEPYVFHYSIPVIEETGDGRVEESESIQSNKLLVKGGELLVSKLNPRKSRVLITVPHDEISVCSSEFVVLRPINCLIQFSRYLYLSEGVRQYLSGNVESATRSHQRVGPEVISKMWALLPPLSEQQRIVAYLDHKTSEINHIIGLKERQVAQLTEKREAVIRQAVTRGLDPDVALRPSGIDWLGNVPAHWETMKINWLFGLIGSGTTPNTSNEDYYEGDFPWVNTSELNDGPITMTKKSVTQKAMDELSALALFPVGTLLIALYGATIGKLGILDIPAATNQACCALGKPSGIRIDFAFYWFLANRRHIISMAYGGGQPNISQELVKQLRLALPPIVEQQAIVNYLNQEISLMDGVAQTVEAQINKLCEWRQALISAAVTGKIDVRGLIA